MWRGIALVFAASVVIARLGVAGCAPVFFPPTKAGGGFNGQAQAPAPAPQAAAAPQPTNRLPREADPAVARNAAATPRSDAATSPEEDLSNPAFFPASKSGGGFFPPPRPAAPQQKQAAGGR